MSFIVRCFQDAFLSQNYNLTGCENLASWAEFLLRKGMWVSVFVFISSISIVICEDQNLFKLQEKYKKAKNIESQVDRSPKNWYYVVYFVTGVCSSLYFILHCFFGFNF